MVQTAVYFGPNQLLYQCLVHFYVSGIDDRQRSCSRSDGLGPWGQLVFRGPCCAYGGNEPQIWCWLGLCFQDCIMRSGTASHNCRSADCFDMPRCSLWQVEIFINWSLWEQTVGLTTLCRNVWLEKYVYFGFPYLIYDLHAMYVAYVAEHGNSLQVFMQYKGSVVIHHAALASLGFPLIIVCLFYLSDQWWGIDWYELCTCTKVWRRGLGDFFVGCILCSEMSTVFLSINMIVKQVGLQITVMTTDIVSLCYKLQMRDTVWYTISGLMLMLSFFFCRILVFPFMYWMYGRYTGQLRLWEVPGAIPWFCTSGCVLVFLFQAYWFRIIFVQTVTGLYKKM